MPTFNEILDGPLPVLLDFTATWCGPCKAQSPILDQLAAKTAGKLRILKIDIDKNPAAANAYGVRGVPTLVLLPGQGGKEVWRRSGVQPLHVLEGALSGVGV